MGRFFSGTRVFGWLVIVILVVAIAGVSLRSRLQSLPWAEKLVLDVTSPVSQLFSAPTYQVESFFSRLRSLRDLYQENQQLQALASDDTSLRIQLALSQQDNQDLKKMLDYKDQHLQYQLIAASVTGRSPVSWDSEFTISAGSLAGVHNNEPILSDTGALVGRVVSVAQFSSTAMLITSTETQDGVSATIVANRNAHPFGIVTGSMLSPGLLEMQFISQLSVGAKIGDEVVTSGLSDMYPKGILIGRIRAFIADGTGITRSASITPAADLGSLYHVFVLVPKPSQVLR